MQSNFQFLEDKWPLLANLGNLAENNLYSDPNTSLIKLRLYSEKIVSIIFDTHRLREPYEKNHNNRLSVLKNEDIVPPIIMDIFHEIRKAGNKAAHEGYGTTKEAETLLLMSFRIGLWFMGVYGRKDLTSLKFVVPEKEDHESKIKKLENEYKQLEEKLNQVNQELISAQVQPTNEELKEIKTTSFQIADNIKLSEAESRKIIDDKLRQAGWEVDTEKLTFKNGTRPQKGKNLAISEWPVGSKFADYALFIGTDFFAIVEAKRQSKEILSDIEQAKVYSRHAGTENGENLIGKWDEYRVPFMFATNGRPYLRQLETKSGIWFLDGRKSNNHPRALQDWYSPQGLKDLLKKDEEAANEKLKNETFNYLTDRAGLGLRDYQQKAIEKIEESIEKNKRAILVSMATGTGKTRTIIGLVYRLLKTGRFKRILFLVDRSILGKQSADAFHDATIEDLLSFTKTYDIKELKDKKPDINTKVHFATVQGMVKRLFYSSDDQETLSVDTYDCIIVDEAHRGYILDKEMDEEDINFRNQEDYIGKYRKVLDYFDAVKIALTATPALHTAQIFGNPVYNYSYREAVIDGHLIDHELPILIETELKRDGIKWNVGDTVKTYDAKSGELEELGPLPDELEIDVSGFNTKVITLNFNRTVVKELVNHLDPEGEKKTLIFAATDSHANLVLQMLKEEFEAAGITFDDNSIKKITGTVYDAQEEVRKFKNERLPNIVITVDLLSTGVDVPEICNIVFLRRIRSRILYEQMLGRATRKADHIGKTHFKIFDAVGIYDILEKVTDMKPVVTNPKINFITMLDQLDTLSVSTPLKGREGEENSDEVLAKERFKRKQIDEIIAKLQRKKRGLSDNSKSMFADRAEGRNPDEFIKWLGSLPVDSAVKELNKSRPLFTFLDEVKEDGKGQIFSEHEDRLVSVGRGYKPDDYLESFRSFIMNNMNLIPALQIVVQRPKELTRKALRELKYELDKLGYSEINLNTAWKDLKNEDIAADVISFIRQQALGDALVSHEDRIKKAVKKVKSLRQWNATQEKWLDRIEKQLLKESVIDRESFERDPFINYGGYDQINRSFGNELDNVIMLINDNLYIA
jgi:type I restriction enzyme R subunit